MLGDEVVGQQLRVAFAQAQRRHLEHQHVEAEREVVAERAAIEQVVQARAGGGDDAHVALALAPATDRPVAVILQEAQQRYLGPYRQRIDLVEEQRAAFGHRDEAGPGFARVGVGAALGAEQLALDQAIGQRAAIERNEGRGAARRLVVDGAGREFLARARLALDQYRRVVARDPGDQRQGIEEDR